MVRPVLAYGSEVRVMNSKDTLQIQAVEMFFLRAVKRCFKRDHLRNEAIPEELNIRCTNNLSSHDIKLDGPKWLLRMSPPRFPLQSWDYPPEGRGDVDQLRKIVPKTGLIGPIHKARGREEESTKVNRLSLFTPTREHAHIHKA